MKGLAWLNAVLGLTGNILLAITLIAGITVAVRVLSAPKWVVLPGACLAVLVIFAEGAYRLSEEQHEIIGRKDEVVAALTDEAALTLKDLLGKADQEGHELYSGDPSIEEAEEWGTRTHNLIEAALGRGEAQLFLSNAGYTFLSGGKTEQQIWIEGRLRRLAELQARVHEMKIRSSFNPQL
jgi:hypothetical protein